MSESVTLCEPPLAGHGVERRYAVFHHFRWTVVVSVWHHSQSQSLTDSHSQFKVGDSE